MSKNKPRGFGCSFFLWTGLLVSILVMLLSLVMNLLKK